MGTLVSAAFAFALLQSQAPVTFETQSVRLKVALPAISKLLHSNCVASPLLSNEFIAISVHDVPPQELQERIAQTMCAEWKPFDGGVQLVPNGEASKTLRMRALAAGTEKAKKLIADARALLEATPSFRAIEASALLDRLKKVDDVYNAKDAGTGDGREAERSRLREAGLHAFTHCRICHWDRSPCSEAPSLMMSSCS